MEIIRAHTAQEIDEIRVLFREYEAWLGVDLGFQEIEEELATLPGKYAAPDGVLLLARKGRAAVGCAALRRFGSVEEKRCEMKRLYVRPEARGMGVGRALAEHLIAEACRLDYGTMLLDTLDRLRAAMGLYESLGFEQTSPYYENPLAGVVYWRLDLKSRQARGPAG